MVPGQELEVQQKRELTKKDEATISVGNLLPNTDIYETEDGLIVVMEMPGVEKDHTELTLEDGVLSVSGRIDFSKVREFSAYLYRIQHRLLSSQLQPFSQQHRRAQDHSRYEGWRHRLPCQRPSGSNLERSRSSDNDAAARSIRSRRSGQQCRLPAIRPSKNA